MSFSTTEVRVPVAERVDVTEDTLTADLSDGRTISVPLAWYPRLVHATPKERRNWRLIGGGAGIHWPGLDEDLSVEGLLAGAGIRRESAFVQALAGNKESGARRERRAVIGFNLMTRIAVLGPIPPNPSQCGPSRGAFLIGVSGCETRTSQRPSRDRYRARPWRRAAYREHGIFRPGAHADSPGLPGFSIPVRDTFAARWPSS